MSWIITFIGITNFLCFQVATGRRLQPPCLSGYNLKEAPTPQFSGYNPLCSQATTWGKLQLPNSLATTRRRLQRPSFSGYNLREAPNTQFSGYNPLCSPATTRRRLQPPSFLGYNLKEAPTPQFSGYNQKEDTTPYVLWLQPEGGYVYLFLPHPTTLSQK